MIRLNYLLKQHTPLIHFQFEQDGALLRATEVKPKLDKFIWSILLFEYNNDLELTFEKFGEWLSGYSKDNHHTYKKEFAEGKRNALNYSMRFFPGLVEKFLIPEADRSRNPDAKQPFFFGNMGDGYQYDKKSLHYTAAGIKMELLLKNTSKIEGRTLEDILEKNINQFFLNHNFGTRQTKGYGSFYLSKDSRGYLSPASVAQVSGKMPYSFVINGQNRNFLEDSKKCLDEMEVIYRALRSGINTTSFGQQGIYLKSVLWTYFKNKINGNIKWEKKKTKEKFFNPNQARHIERHEDDPGFVDSPLGSKGVDELAIKDLFGLSSVESWGAEYNATITKEIEGIDRFRSPVLFKPILTGNGDYIVYFDAIELTEDNSILNKTIRIINGNDSFSIKSPISFDFYDFFNYLIQDYKLEQNLVIKINGSLSFADSLNDREKRGVREYRILKNFFNTLR